MYEIRQVSGCGTVLYCILLVPLLPFMAELLQMSTWTGWVIRCIHDPDDAVLFKTTMLSFTQLELFSHGLKISKVRCRGHKSPPYWTLPWNSSIKTLSSLFIPIFLSTPRSIFWPFHPRFSEIKYSTHYPVQATCLHHLKFLDLISPNKIRRLKVIWTGLYRFKH